LRLAKLSEKGQLASMIRSAQKNILRRHVVSVVVTMFYPGG